LKEADRNTKFFHRKAAGRAKKNKVNLPRKGDGRLKKDRDTMLQMTRDFFQNLYKADPSVNPQEVLQYFQPCISEDVNLELCKEITTEEISDALFQIGPLKAPGPDGFPARFFQRNWEVMKADVISAIQHFF
jgi:hypothetical protein